MKTRKVINISIILIIAIISFASCKSIEEKEIYSAENTQKASKENINYSDYPENLIPLYNQSTVISYEKNEEKSILKYKTENEVEDVIDFYLKIYENSNYLLFKEDTLSKKYLVTYNYDKEEMWQEELDLGSFEFNWEKDNFKDFALAFNYYNYDTLKYIIIIEQSTQEKYSIEGKNGQYEFEITLNKSDSNTNEINTVVEIEVKDNKYISNSDIGTLPEIQPEIDKIEFIDTYTISNGTIYSVIGGYVINTNSSKYYLNADGLYMRNDIVIGKLEDLKDIETGELLYDWEHPEFSTGNYYIISTDDSPYEGIDIDINTHDTIMEYTREINRIKVKGAFKEYPYGEAHIMTLAARPIFENTKITIQNHKYGTAVFGNGFGLFVSKEGIKMPPPFLPEFESDIDFATYLMRTYNDVFAAYEISNKYIEDNSSVRQDVYNDAKGLINTYDLDEWYLLFYTQASLGEKSIDKLWTGGNEIDFKYHFKDSRASVFEYNYYPFIFNTTESNQLRFSYTDILECFSGKNFVAYRGHDKLYLFKLRDEKNYKDKINEVLEGYYFTYDAYSVPSQAKVEKIYNSIVNESIDFLQAHCLVMNAYMLNPIYVYYYGIPYPFLESYKLSFDELFSLNLSTEYEEIHYYTFIKAVYEYIIEYYQNSDTRFIKLNSDLGIRAAVEPVYDCDPVNYSGFSKFLDDSSIQESQKNINLLVEARHSENPYVGEYILEVLKDGQGNVLHPREGLNKYWRHSFCLAENGEILRFSGTGVDGEWILEDNKLLINNSQLINEYSGEYFVEDGYIVLSESVEEFGKYFKDPSKLDDLSELFGYYKRQNYD